MTESNSITGSARPLLSVVAPCRDEADNLRQFLEEITTALATVGEYEILVVDDGSTDGSLELLKALKGDYPRLRVLALDGGYGQTAALGAGFKAARGEIIAMIDADLQDDPADIPRMMERLREVDAVNGWRAVRQDNLLRLLSGRIANRIRNWATDETIVDSASGLKVFRRECLVGLKLFKGLHRFLPTLLRMEGFRVAEIPVNHRPRLRGRSKYGLWNRMFKAFHDLLAVRWMKARQLRYTAREV